MLVKYLNTNTFDIFFNDGWENWARFHVEKGKLVQITGVPVPKNIQLFLENRYKK